MFNVLYMEIYEMNFCCLFKYFLILKLPIYDIYLNIL